jgi:hypothetical protein
VFGVEDSDIHRKGDKMDYANEYEAAARKALEAIEWDGFDPRPVSEIILVLAAVLEDAGHSSASVAEMFRKISDVGAAA